MSDTELARGAQCGDQASLGMLLSLHQAAMRAVALNLLGSGAEADDAVQDAMLVALSKIGERRDPAAAGAWLRTITRNCCLMRLRARREVPLATELSLVPGELPPGDGHRAARAA